MAWQMPRSRSHNVEDAACTYLREVEISFKPKWYFTEEEIEGHSPSRKDGISREHESHLRQLYCSYLQKLGMELKLPQLSIATAMVLCHRFYMYQSHAKNHWQAVANSIMFLSSKAEDTPCSLKDLVVVAYKLMYNWDPLAAQKIRQKDVFDKQKQLILLGEQLILVTLAFDLNIEHPYKPLVTALKKLEISQKEVIKVAWNFVNDWVRTTLCLQYKPHYIAAGSVFLAAKLHKIKLPSSSGNVWWMQFDVSPKLLEDVIQHMLRLLGKSNKQTVPSTSEVKNEQKPVSIKRKFSSPNVAEQDPSKYSVETCENTPKCASVIRGDGQTKPTTEKCLSDSGSTVEDSDQINGESNQEWGCKIVSIKKRSHEMDITKIREKLKQRKMEKKQAHGKMEVDMSDEAWIEKELEMGIEMVPA